MFILFVGLGCLFFWFLGTGHDLKSDALVIWSGDSMPGYDRIAVLGGAGYLGSHICAQLVDRGYSPLVIDNLSTGYRQFCSGSSLVVSDAADVNTIEPFFSGTKDPLGDLSG